MLVLIRRNIAQSAVVGLRPALAQVARNRRNNRALHLRVSVHLRHRHDVLRVPVMPLVVDELAGIAQHGGRGQPVLVLRRQLMQRFEVAKQLHSVRAHRFGLPHIHSVALSRRDH